MGVGVGVRVGVRVGVNVGVNVGVRLGVGIGVGGVAELDDSLWLAGGDGDDVGLSVDGASLVGDGAAVGLGVAV